MVRVPIIAFAFLLSAASPLTSWAQGAEVSVGASALISAQPIDDAYVGGPYLSEGIGGMGPGMSATFTVVTSRRLVVAAEFSTAWYEQQQSGRLVPAPCPPGTPGTPSNECSFVGGVGTTALNDSMIGGLLGYSMRGATTQVDILGGAYWLLDRPTVNGVSLADGNEDEGDFPLSLGGGLDVLFAVGPRTALVVGGRYTYLQRDEHWRYLGIGPHVVRAGVGVRIRLN